MTRPISYSAGRYAPLWRRLWRRQLILPAEHGAWAWLSFPFLVGLALAGGWHPAVWLTLAAALAIFLLRQPATLWLRVRRGKARASDGPLALIWMAILLGVAALSLAGLTWIGRGAVWQLAPAITALLAAYLLVAGYGPAAVRTTWLELLGAAGLAVTAPAALASVTGRLTTEAWLVWGVMGSLNILGVLYVRLRLADTHQRRPARTPLIIVHLLMLGLAAGAALAGWLPPFIPWLYVALLGRAGWVWAAPRPIPHIRRFGFQEVGVEALLALGVALSFLSL